MVTERERSTAKWGRVFEELDDNELLLAYEICEKIVNDNPKEVSAYLAGKETLLGWFTGQVMQAAKGKADAKRSGEILKELLAGTGD